MCVERGCGEPPLRAEPGNGSEVIGTPIAASVRSLVDSKADLLDSIKSRLKQPYSDLRYIKVKQHT